MLAAEPSLTQQPGTVTEITYLLNEVATSSCEFNRNGKWYQGRQAAAHLRNKYGARPPWEHIGTAEEFIDRIAARSQTKRLRRPRLDFAFAVVDYDVRAFARELYGTCRAYADS